jgi:hypothetical protein
MGISPVHTNRVLQKLRQDGVGPAFRPFPYFLRQDKRAPII